MDHPSSGVPRDIPFHLLEEITDGFSKERELGRGAYGKVYMGIHKNGEKIAVKMLHDMPGLEEDQFLNEFNNLARLHHQNIVRIVGYCHETRKEYVQYNGRLVFAERNRRLLCFEYMHYGGLDKYLSDEQHGLDWSTRYKIIKGISMGLKYLHEELESPIYHLDLKPGNILLDENMVPKIADFGLSRLFGEEKTQITGSSIGTCGYLPPEYIERNIISNKFDIFSLGVVIIKIMAGPESYFKSADMPPQQFVEHVHGNWRNRLQETQLHMLEAYAKQVKICIEIALSCVEVNRHKRPSIGDIVKALKETETLIPKTSQFPHWRANDLGPLANQMMSSWLEDVELDQMFTPIDPFKIPQITFAHDTLQQRLQALIEGFRVEETWWSYAIFWQQSMDVTSESKGCDRRSSSLLGWGDGYYMGEHRECNAHDNSKEEEISDKMWSNLVSMMKSVLCGTDVQGQEQQQHRKRVFSKLRAFISASNPNEIAVMTEVGVPDREQEHRKRVLRELNALISGADSSAFEDEVSDSEWFFLISGTQSFLGASGLPGQAMLAGKPIWIANGLSSAPCERARQAYSLGLRTMVCVPIGDGVIELGSTESIFQTTESVAKIISYFNLPIKPNEVPEHQHHHRTAGEKRPDVSDSDVGQHKRVKYFEFL